MSSIAQRMHLPGMSPGALQVTLVDDGGPGDWRVTVKSAESPAFLAGAPIDVYGPMTLSEALDVVGAVFEVLALAQPE